jgi:threonine aldolase
MNSSLEGYVDLRSDTVTQPSPAMRRAMAEAEVGDDRYGNDPSVNRLQEAAAELMGKPAALYLPTGRLCNQLAVHVLAKPGHLVVCDASAHIGSIEAGSAALLSRVAFRPVRGHHGLLTKRQVASALAPDPYGVEIIDLVTLENTHQLGGGSVLPLATLSSIAGVCAQRGVALYLDGARIFNACAATGHKVKDYASQVDALMFCLSKGLGAPIGSLLAGTSEFIDEVRHLRILYGAGWRQAGIMAAAGLIALREGPKTLHEDHVKARWLANGIAGILPGAVDPYLVETNIVFADIRGTGHDAGRWQQQLAGHGLLVTRVPGRIRMLTHRDVSPRGIDVALTAWREAANELAVVR